MKAYLFSKNVACIVLLSLFLSTPVMAQMKGDHILGYKGLSAGSQQPPSLVVAVPFYFYNTSTFKDGDGNKLTNSPEINTFLTGIGASIVPGFKILNATYGASILIPFVKNRIELDTLSASPSFAFSDIFIQPLSLGWKLKQADLSIGYQIYIPTGKYKTGGSDNSGLGMWGHEFTVGGTYYFDKLKLWNFSTLASYELHSSKLDSDRKAGDLFTLEGGLNKNFYVPLSGSKIPMIIGVGAIYYMQFKVTDDTFPDLTVPISIEKDHIYGVGLEGNMFYPKTETALSVRWVSEMGALNRTEGNTFFITLSQVLKMF